MEDDPYGGESLDVGLTGLSVLAFLGAGLGPTSSQRFVDPFHPNTSSSPKEYAVGPDVISKALRWLVGKQRPDGSFSTPTSRCLYNEAIAAAALAEAFGVTHDDSWRLPAQRAIDYLCAAQKPSPPGKGKWGWRYGSRVDIEALKSTTPEKEYEAELRDSDVSVTGWAAMALTAALTCGFSVPQTSIDGALAYVKWASAPSGLVGYTTPESAGEAVTQPHDAEFSYPMPSMASIGMCVRIFLEHDPKDDYLKKSAERIIQSLPANGQDPRDRRKSLRNYYYWYYGSLAMNQFDGPTSPNHSGKYWTQWNTAMQQAVLAEQSQLAVKCSAGGFLQPDSWSYNAGPVYSTAINVLTLEVYYRYENAFVPRKK